MSIKRIGKFTKEQVDMIFAFKRRRKYLKDRLLLPNCKGIKYHKKEIEAIEWAMSIIAPEFDLDYTREDEK